MLHFQTIVGRDWNATGSLVGIIGMVTVSVANICMVTLDTSCEAKYGFQNVTVNVTYNGSETVNTTSLVLLHENTCESALQITTAFMALCGATLLWSLSAGKLTNNTSKIHTYFKLIHKIRTVCPVLIR